MNESIHSRQNDEPAPNWLESMTKEKAKVELESFTKAFKNYLEHELLAYVDPRIVVLESKSTRSEQENQELTKLIAIKKEIALIFKYLNFSATFLASNNLERFVAVYKVAKGRAIDLKLGITNFDETVSEESKSEQS